MRAASGEEKRRIRVGCAAWCFTFPGYGAPYEAAIQTIGELGFTGLELIIFSEKDAREYYTKSRIQKLSQQYRSYKLTLSQVAIYNDPVAGLASLKRHTKAQALRFFERACGIASALGSPVINMVSQWPEGVTGPTAYPPHAIYLEARGQERFYPKLNLTLPADFSWREVWENYLDSLRQCADTAREHGLVLALEGHTNVLVANADAMLRVFERVNRTALGANLDTGWHLMQREFLPLSIHKLGTRIYHVHARDGDGLFCYNLPPGQGIIDWEGVIAALVAVGYRGFVSLEFTRYADPARYAAAAKAHLEEIIARCT